MTRNVGQLTARRTIAGLAAVAISATLSVQVLEGLIDSREVTLEAPAEPSRQSCQQLVDAAGAEPWSMSSSDFVECPRELDGRRVTYGGEAVRAVLLRGEHAWVHLNDDPYGVAIGPLPEHRTAVGGNSGIPVLIPRHAAAAVTHVGDHSALGDVLEVTGTFFRAAPFDGGGPAILADRVDIVRRGRPIERSISASRVALAVAGMVLAGALALLARRR